MVIIFYSTLSLQYERSYKPASLGKNIPNQLYKNYLGHRKNQPTDGMRVQGWIHLRVVGVATPQDFGEYFLKNLPKSHSKP